jgi:Domain of unknown function (DUF3291)
MTPGTPHGSGANAWASRRYSRRMRSQLAQVNIGGLAAPGFVRRLQTEEGNATAIVAFQWDRADSHGVLVNMSVWESVEALADFVSSDAHRAILRRRRAFFRGIREATTCMWWVPEGELPPVEDAEDRIRHIREHSPTPDAFTFRHPFGPPEGVQPHAPPTGGPDWLGPA